MLSIGTLLYTWFNGEQVGTDEFGNRYYQAKSDTLHGRQRRWVIYKGKIEASRVPPEWHAWLHHFTEEPLTEAAAKAPGWQQPHQPNMTGTAQAYRPPGHDFKGGQRSAATGDYEPWAPE